MGPAADELAVHARLMIGIMVNDLSVGTTIANLGMTEVKFPHPLFEDDTVHCTTEVISKRKSTSRPGAGIVDSTIALTIRTTSSSPNAAARFSCACGRADALTAFRTGRRRQQARQGDGERRRRGHRRSGRFDLAGRQGGGATERSSLMPTPSKPPPALACWSASTALRPALPTPISSDRARVPRRHHAAEGRRRRGHSGRRQAGECARRSRSGRRPIKIVAIATETARALFLAGTYRGASARLEGLTWGAEDFPPRLGAEANRDPAAVSSTPIGWRAHLPCRRRGRGVQAIDTVTVDFRNVAALRRRPRRRAATALPARWRSIRHRCRSSTRCSPRRRRHGEGARRRRRVRANPARVPSASTA